MGLNKEPFDETKTLRFLQWAESYKSTVSEMLNSIFGRVVGDIIHVLNVTKKDGKYKIVFIPIIADVFIEKYLKDIPEEYLEVEPANNYFNMVGKAYVIYGKDIDELEAKLTYIKIMNQ